MSESATHRLERLAAGQRLGVRWRAAICGVTGWPAVVLEILKGPEIVAKFMSSRSRGFSEAEARESCARMALEAA